MAHQKPWNEYETALLIEAYINVKEHGKNLDEELSKLSMKLRNIAVANGEVIDETYRNLNGMHWQYGFIKLAFERATYESRKPTELFLNMVELYKTDRETFNNILQIANQQERTNQLQKMEGEDNKVKFQEWLLGNDTKKHSIAECVECMDRVSKYAVSHSVSRVQFWEISNFRVFNKIRVSLSGNKIFRLSHPVVFRSFERIGKYYSDFLRDTFGEPVKTEPAKAIVSVTSTLEMSVEEKKPEAEVIDLQDNKPKSEDDILLEFSEWMIKERNLAIRSSQAYASNMRICNAYALERKIIKESLFSTDESELESAVNSILDNEDFSKYNAEQHNRFSAALNAYLVFVLGEKAEKRRRRKSKSKEEVIVCPSELRQLLLQKFPFGIRVDSQIDLLKLKSFAEMCGMALAEDDLLKKQIFAGGFCLDGKVYFISDIVCDEVISKVYEVFETGSSVIFYEPFFDMNLDWLEEKHISSVDIVREIISARADEIYVNKNFFAQGRERISEEQAVERELKRVWGDAVVHTYDEVYEELPMIPNDKIRFYLSRCLEFVWSSNETFTRLSKFIITDNEKEVIFDFVNEKCAIDGYVSIADVPLGNIVEENYQISLTAIFDCIYRLILREHFSINGKIITKGNSELDALVLTKAFCEGKEKCTFSELADYVFTLTGSSNRQIAFRAGYDQMVRVNEDLFVADEFVDFDIEAIDEILGKSIIGDFTSIRNIATFALFPNCGYSWNYYLLESFCYKISKKFRLEIINFNDKNAGIIAKKDLEMSYFDMLASVAANSNVDLNVEAVGRYLFNNGYTAKSKMAALNDIVEKARAIREGR